ncbi:MAG: hypothetical protein QOJ65_2364, partial [Fimbriimonadaceae bacterium]|nr:hypothetical protein [Fimbriimonadaceae bacterium]
MRMKEMALVAVLATCAVPAFAQQGASPSARQESTSSALVAKLAEAKELKEKAAAVTKALSSVSTTDRQAADTLQQILDQLKSLGDRITSLEQEMTAMKGKKTDEKKPSGGGATTRVSGFTQLQYRASENKGEFDGFGARRVRINLNHDADERTHLKVSYDFATTQFGSTINEPTESGGQLRDAFVTY